MHAKEEIILEIKLKESQKSLTGSFFRAGKSFIFPPKSNKIIKFRDLF